MDALNSGVPTEEAEAPSARQTLASIAEQCDHALTHRIAKRFSTRDSLKTLEKRARALLEQEDSRDWIDGFEKVVTTANAVFDQLIAEAEPTAHA